MLPLPIYNPGGYPPRGPFVQWGDAQLGHSFEEANKALQDNLMKKIAFGQQRRMEHKQHHLEELRHQGRVPAHYDMTRDDVAQFLDAESDVPRPEHLPPPFPDNGSELDGSVVPLPEDDEFEDAHEPSHVTPEEQGRLLDVAQHATSLAARQAANLGGYMGRNLKNNVVATANMMQAGAQVGAQVAGVLSAELQRSASNASAAASAAMQPGSATRTTLADAAGSAQTAARTVLDVAGPPVVLGGYLAAEAGRHTANAVGSVAATAARATVNHVLPAVGSAAAAGIGGFASFLGKTAWSLGDVIHALNEASKVEPQAIADATSHELMTPFAIEGSSSSSSRRSRNDTPPRRPHTTSASTTATHTEKPHYEHSYKTVEEWLRHSKSKGFLVEQIYLRPGWGKLLGVADAKGFHTEDTQHFRKRLLKMTPAELAGTLVHLDSM